MPFVKGRGGKPAYEFDPQGNRNADGFACLRTSGFYGQGDFGEFEDEMRRASLFRPRRIPPLCLNLSATGCTRNPAFESLWFATTKPTPETANATRAAA